MRTVLITGGTSGIGKATANAIAAMGWRVIFTARNSDKAASVKNEIIGNTGNKNVDFVLADLTSVVSVSQCAKYVSDNYENIDVLINNAGVCLPERRITADGFEESFQINYLSHFILTNLLLDKICKSEDPRIINLSSAAHAAGRFDPGNLNSEKYYSPVRTYSDTKLYNILFTLELAERLKGRISVNALHPGVVSTNFGHEFGGVFNFIYNLGRPFMITPQKGAKTSIYLASSDDVKGMSGKYFVRCKPVRLKNRYLTEENRKMLWQRSLELTGIEDLK
jgi:NAD(P)-dependent dehydrogenase (short-subunit alcohol dehydrogenase family)